MILKALGYLVLGLFAICVAGLLSGCLHAPARRNDGLVGAAPADPVKYAACEKIRTRHNVLATLGGGISLSAGVGGLAGDRAVGNAGQVTLGASGVALAIIGSVLGAFGGFAGDEYSRNNCSAVPAP